MKRSLKRIIVFISLLVLLLFVLFVINQTVQVVGFASRVSPAFGTIVLWVLLAVYATFVAVPLVVYLRLPRSLTPPESEGSKVFHGYLEGLKRRLAKNPRLKGRTFLTREDIEAGLGLLNGEADGIIRKTAAKTFIATAISQNGRLDAFLVLSALSRMVWQIAHLYYQRPAPRELLQLYANVAATVFVASELEDIDVYEQVAPVVSSAVGSVALSVPGTGLLVDSIVTGTANAFLALRVGVMARRYCGSLTTGSRASLRRSATIEAIGLLGPVVREGVAKIPRAVWAALWQASKREIAHRWSSASARAKESGRRFLSKGKAGGKQPQGQE